MGAFPSFHLLVVLLTIFLSDAGPAMSCLESERQALLMFKGGLIDESNRLGSWVDVGGGNCCDWYGVSCNNSTGHVIGLHLQAPPYDPHLYLSYEDYNKTLLRGTISPLLLHLKQLLHLNLSWNDFGGTRIPPFLGLMTSLEQLDLSYAGFGGKIPSQIGNLTNLDYLGLGGYRYSLSTDSLQWVSSLSLLHHLDLSNVHLSKARDWFHSINTIPYLSELILKECGLHHLPSVPLVNNFSSLAVLDLSENSFRHSSIPKWIFHLHNLNTLDLSYCNLQASPISEGFQNLSRLRSLDLSGNNFNSSILSWLYRFSSGLEFLSLRGNNLQGVISSAFGNLTSLIGLQLGDQNGGLEIGGRETIQSMGRLCHLKFLELSGMKVNQDVVDVFNDLLSSRPSNGLEELILDSAGIFGNITNLPFQKFKSLVYLDLTNNSISGSIPPSFGELQSLEIAIFEENLMVGSVSEIHFAKLAGLKWFWASGNKLELKVSPSWNPPFQLEILVLSSWQLGREFPRWLHSQKSIEVLQLSGCNIEGTIPKWFGEMSSQLESLNLSNNQLRGEVPIFSSNLVSLDLSNNSFESLDLSNNSFESISKGFWNFSRTLDALILRKNQISGEIPSDSLLQTVYDYGTIDLSSNNFHGRLPRFHSKLGTLDLSSNFFSGSLSHSLCYQMNEEKWVLYLNLENNSLSGKIPNCWKHWIYLEALKLNNNNFIGRIPKSMQNLRSLQSLHIRNNSLEGGLSLSWRSFQNLVTVDLAENRLQGQIPSLIGLSNLTILDLRSNWFHGKVPHEICALTSLQILDLANNNLYGHIPRCIKNFKAMVTNDSLANRFREDASLRVGGVGGYLEEAIVVIQGRVMEYSTTLNLLRVMDFSNNLFSGTIPDQVTALTALQSLNLSHNMLVGGIPQNIGAMKSLESLDLSRNKLVGEIPSSITSITFISHLNLSSNKLTGRIPSSTQLQSFDASSFAGNDLCGPPLPNSCDEDEAHGGAQPTFIDVECFVVSMAFGFVFGFWGFLFHLLCNRKWRIVYGQEWDLCL